VGRAARTHTHAHTHTRTQSVIIDSDVLATLPPRELASGFSEIIKYGLIRDTELFVWLEGNMGRLLARDPEAIAYAVERSCINKAQVGARLPMMQAPVSDYGGSEDDGGIFWLVAFAAQCCCRVGTATRHLTTHVHTRDSHMRQHERIFLGLGTQHTRAHAHTPSLPPPRAYQVVAADERELNDIRATLNLGHTFGHAIENFAGAPRQWLWHRPRSSA
jgi:hypothetical protein